MFEALANWLIYDLAGLADSALGAAAHFFVMDVTKILVLLTLVIYVMGLLRAVPSPERVREFIRRRSNVSARFLAVGLGAVTPFCSCSSIPLFIGFGRRRKRWPGPTSPTTWSCSTRSRSPTTSRRTTPSTWTRRRPRP